MRAMAGLLLIAASVGVASSEERRDRISPQLCEVVTTRADGSLASNTALDYDDLGRLVRTESQSYRGRVPLAETRVSPTVRAYDAPGRITTETTDYTYLSGLVDKTVSVTTLGQRYSATTTTIQYLDERKIGERAETLTGNLKDSSEDRHTVAVREYVYDESGRIIETEEITFDQATPQKTTTTRVEYTYDGTELVSSRTVISDVSGDSARITTYAKSNIEYNEISTETTYDEETGDLDSETVTVLDTRTGQLVVKYYRDSKGSGIDTTTRYRYCCPDCP